MAKKKKRKFKRKSSGIGWIITFLIVLILCIVAVFGLKLTEKIGTELDHKIYPLKYTDFVYKYADEYEVPRSVVLAMIKVESNFKADANSQAGACGLMQLMPDTFIWLASKLGEEVTPEQIYDPDINIKYGTYYISLLYESFGDWDNVYAAYNAGKANVNKWLADERYSKDGKLTDIPYAETANHVKKVNNARNKYIELYHIGG